MYQQPKPIYFKNLDALRAVAALAVICFHISILTAAPDTGFYKGLNFLMSFSGQAGKLGVVFFFILSGFLITYLMLVEQEQKGRLHIKNFYIRRALRIWPLYFATLLIGFVAYPGLRFLLKGIIYQDNANWLLHALFLTNFDYLLNGIPEVRILAVQWSVAIEEQFYLLWPLLFLVFSKRQAFPFVLLLIILLSELFYLSVDPLTVGYFHSLSAFRFLAFGGLLAYMSYHYTDWLQAMLGKISRWQGAVFYSSAVLLMLFHAQISALVPMFRHVNHLLPFLFFGFVVVEQSFSVKPAFALGKSRLLSWLGKISYGLYMTHVMAIYLVLALFPQSSDYFLLKASAVVLLSVLISYGSYRFLEKPFLELKNSFSAVGATAIAAAKDAPAPLLPTKVASGTEEEQVKA